MYIVVVRQNHSTKCTQLRRWHSLLVRSPRMRKFGCSNPTRYRPQSLKQVEAAPLQKSLATGVNVTCHYKRMSRVTVGVAR